MIGQVGLGPKGDTVVKSPPKADIYAAMRRTTSNHFLLGYSKMGKRQQKSFAGAIRRFAQGRSLTSGQAANQLPGFTLTSDETS